MNFLKVFQKIPGSIKLKEGWILSIFQEFGNNLLPNSRALLSMNCKNRLQDTFSNYGMIKILCSFIFFFMITVDIALFIGVSYYFDIRKFEIFSS